MLSVSLGLPSLVRLTKPEPDLAVILFTSLLGELDTLNEEDLIAQLVSALAFTGEMVDNKLSYEHVPVPKLQRHISPPP